MRLVLIGTDRRVFEPGSAVRERIISFAKKAGPVDLIIFSTRAYGLRASQELAPGVRAYPTNSHSRFLYGWDALRIAATLPKPDLISTQDTFEVGLCGLVYARRYGIPLAVEMHTDFLSSNFVQHSFLNRVRRHIAGFVLRHSNGGYAVSKRLRDEVMRTWQLQIPIVVAPIYIPVARYAVIERTHHPRFKTTLLWVGRLESEKRPEIAVEALASARSEGHDVGLVLVGSGSLTEATQKIVQDLGLTEYVEFVGFKNDVRPWLACADLLLVTSSYEGYGMVIIEALAAGVPVLSTDVGVAREAGAQIAGSNFSTALGGWLEGPREPGSLQMQTYASIDEYHETILDCYRAILTESAP